MKKWLLSLPTFLLLYSCNQSSLTVQTDYISHKNLASYYVKTPDPRLNFPTIGERLIVGWAVPKEYLNYENLHLKITIRFRNREEMIEIFHLSKTRGTYVFNLLNADYISTRGILTYKIDLIGGDVILEEWRHRIWKDLILINMNLQHPPQQQLNQQNYQDLQGYQDQREQEEYPINWDEDTSL